jgi:hypothetical protein
MTPSRAIAASVRASTSRTVPRRPATTSRCAPRSTTAPLRAPAGEASASRITWAATRAGTLRVDTSSSRARILRSRSPTSLAARCRTSGREARSLSNAVRGTRTTEESTSAWAVTGYRPPSITGMMAIDSPGRNTSTTCSPPSGVTRESFTPPDATMKNAAASSPAEKSRSPWSGVRSRHSSTSVERSSAESPSNRGCRWSTSGMRPMGFRPPGAAPSSHGRAARGSPVRGDRIRAQ